MYHLAPFLNLATELNYVCADLQIIQHERSQKKLASPGHQSANSSMQELISPWTCAVVCVTSLFSGSRAQQHSFIRNRMIAKLDAQKCCTNQPGEGTSGARRTSHLRVWTRKTDFRNRHRTPSIARRRYTFTTELLYPLVFFMTGRGSPAVSTCRHS